MEIREILEDDGVILCVLYFEISNNSEISGTLQKFVAERWKEILRKASHDLSILLTRDCDVKVSTFRFKDTRNRVYILLPRACQGHQTGTGYKVCHATESCSQRLLGLSFEPEECISMRAVLAKLKLVYGESTHAEVGKKNLHPNFGLDETIPVDTILLVEDKDDLFHPVADSRRGDVEFGEAQDAVRDNQALSTSQAASILTTQRSQEVKNTQSESFHEVQLRDDHIPIPSPQATKPASLSVNHSCVEETSGKCTPDGKDPVGGRKLMNKTYLNSVVAGSPQEGPDGKEVYIPKTVPERSLPDGVQQMPRKEGVPKRPTSLYIFPELKDSPSPAQTPCTLSRTSSPSLKYPIVEEGLSQHPSTKSLPAMEFKNELERDSIHALEHHYNRYDSPCIMRALKGTCTVEAAEHTLDQHKDLLMHNTVTCVDHGCAVCANVRALSQKHSTICTVESCMVPHCTTTKKSGSPEIGRSAKCKPPAEETKKNDLPPVQRSHDPRCVTFWEALNSLSSYNGPTDEFLPTGGTLKESCMGKVLSAYNRMPGVFPPVHTLANDNCSEELSTLGEGGNGTVCKVMEKGRIFAVKKCQYIPLEVNIWKEFLHPNLMPLLGVKLFFEPKAARGVTINCLQYMPVFDTDLKAVFQKSGPISVLLKTCSCEKRKVVLGNCKHILRGILKGLQALHTKGIVHRDIKEHNVMLSLNCLCKDVFLCRCQQTAKCDVVLGDFDSLVNITRTTAVKNVAGTHGYRPPEVYKKTVGPACDVYGFGVIALKMFGGRNIDKEKKDVALLCGDVSGPHESMISQLMVKNLSVVEGMQEVVQFIHQCVSPNSENRKSVSELLTHHFLRS